MLTSAIQQDASWPAHKSTRLVRFAAKLLIIFVIAALALWQLIDILVLLIGAILLSIGLCAAARLVRQEFLSSVKLGAIKRMSQLVRSFITAPIVASLPTG